MSKLSLNVRFSLLLALFTGIIVSVLVMLVSAKNEPINFGTQEIAGTALQRPIENVLKLVMRHQIESNRERLGDAGAGKSAEKLRAEADEALAVLTTHLEKLSDTLQFNDKGLASRKRDHLTLTNLKKEWETLKNAAAASTTAAADLKDKHSHLIGDLRGMITHLGDTSNLILDPDLDSYYLMDITLLALPQAQDRIRTVTTEVENLLGKAQMTTEDRVRLGVLVSMMTEADLDRINSDHDTVLNEDPNFYGRQESLHTQLDAKKQKFSEAYKALITASASIAAGDQMAPEKFRAAADLALTESFAYWNDATEELDKLIQNRIEYHHSSKTRAALFSILCLLGALSVAVYFMRNLIGQVRSIVTVLDATSAHIASASVQSATSSTDLSESSTEQAASLQETMASVEEIAAMVSQNAESAQKTRDSVETNRSVAEGGSKNVTEMLGAIHEIKTTNEQILGQMEEGNREFGEIVKIITEIGQKTTVINEIVFQTKLLSFNASVEAARAGEHGKGFAVVAEEVGNLAQMSGNAAQEITNMLSESIKKVNAIVESSRVKVERLVEIGKDKVAQGESTAARCSEALKQITENARLVANMVGEITHASKEQDQGIQEINKAISQLDQVTQRNSTVAQQSADQSNQLRLQSQELAKAVESLVHFVDGSKAQAIGTIDAQRPSHKNQTETKLNSSQKAAA